MAFHLVRLPADLEFIFRCKVHSCAIKGHPNFERRGPQNLPHYELDLSDMSCPQETTESPCETVADSWELFYREEH